MAFVSPFCQSPKAISRPVLQLSGKASRRNRLFVYSFTASESPSEFSSRLLADALASMSGRDPGNDLLALLIENKILARRGSAELLEANPGMCEFARRFQPDEAAVTVPPQNVVRCRLHRFFRHEFENRTDSGIWCAVESQMKFRF